MEMDRSQTADRRTRDQLAKGPAVRHDVGGMRRTEAFNRSVTGAEGAGKMLR